MQMSMALDRTDAGGGGSGGVGAASAVVHEVMTPPLRALSHPTFINSGVTNALNVQRGLTSRRSTLEAPAERPSLCPSSPRSHPRPATYSESEFILPDEEVPFIPLLDSSSSSTVRATTGEESASPPLDSPSRAQRALTPMSFTDDMLLRHISEANFGDAMTTALDEAIRRGQDTDAIVSFRDFATFERESYVSTTLEVYEVTAAASAKKTSADINVQECIRYNGQGAPYEGPDGIVDAPTVWEAIKNINPDGDAVGRIVIVQEPTPLILAALHLTMAPHFDMDELLDHLLSEAPNRGRTNAFMERAFEKEASSSSLLPLPQLPAPFPGTQPWATSSLGGGFSSNVRQRSFFFVFKYYTSVPDGLEAAPWQRFDKRPSDKRLGDHIDIAECSSVLALSLGGEPIKPLRMRPRREPTKEGFLYDTFGPWHLLSIQSFPDDQHTVRGDQFRQKSFYNGPYAFLDLLVSEYRDAGKRNQILHEKITKLITPPPEFMFDRRLRDKLLFEDKHFTYIRRYFWAYNTLAVINTGIKAMVAAYLDTFTDDFWAGSHPLLWPHASPNSPEGRAYAAKMALLRRELEKVVTELGEVLKRNERTRKEVENLRDQLFSGSSIKESRRAVDQGDNIRILTMISMIFLPLTFVTSVFGITEFTIPATDWRFAVTMVLVCVPFMALVLLLQTRVFTLVVARVRRTLLLVFTYPYRLYTRALEQHRHQQQQQHQRHGDLLGTQPSVYFAKRRKKRLVTGSSGGVALDGGGAPASVTPGGAETMNGTAAAPSSPHPRPPAWKWSWQRLNAAAGAAAAAEPELGRI
ncbi:Mg2+ transporter protein, CorA-like/Zinc transport protein ZntB [Moelleriella libera RCEF 2490]|uniref:Mg2+ transporter protein, CorA-like/Zinc transport protein ZntB n=1 Tax=Moelleriella libera RCEF 2490 TaxID=1081109 RepID=A0A168AR97_9HYPO|nr:Mg2+ transporter protein, CorA-like/Zinc transport protein ZntB [Moelleriella libera RCEF 2490]